MISAARPKIRRAKAQIRTRLLPAQYDLGAVDNIRTFGYLVGRP